jgi:hypothetical protein
MRGTPRRNLDMFRHLCGADALRNVILTTTNWDRVPDELGSKREAQLMSEFWEPMISHGSQVARFQPSTYESAWDIIDRLDTNTRPVLQMQDEMVNQGKKLHETTVFRFLVQWWAQAMQTLKGMWGKRGRRGFQEQPRAWKDSEKKSDNRNSQRSESATIRSSNSTRSLLQNCDGAQEGRSGSDVS